MVSFEFGATSPNELLHRHFLTALCVGSGIVKNPMKLVLGAYTLATLVL